MDFEILGEISDVETIAVGKGIRELSRLRKRYGPRPLAEAEGFRRSVSRQRRDLLQAEVHWYEASGIDKREFKIKRFL